MSSRPWPAGECGDLLEELVELGVGEL